MSNSSLVTYTRISPNRTSPRNHAIDTITIHCFVGQVTAKAGCDYLANASVEASANYVVGKDGSIGLCVSEADRSWCSSSKSNDHRAVTIEVASDTEHPYAVTDAAYNALIKLVADICQRNGIKKLVWSTSKTDRVNHKNGCNMTVHRDFANKACPGEYLYNRHGDIAKRVNALLTPAVGFSDVPAGVWYAEAVKWATEKGIAKGVDSAHFAPEQTCTRAEAVTFLWRANGSPASTLAARPFADIEPGAYYYKAVLWAVEKGITTGVDEDHFEPNSPCARSQIVTMLWRAAGAPATQRVARIFADVPQDAWYANAVDWAVAHGITTGTDDAHFQPEEPCTRAQMVAFLHRAYR